MTTTIGTSGILIMVDIALIILYIPIIRFIKEI
jgi:hypothetical protein